MMKYMGSKAKHATAILDAIENELGAPMVVWSSFVKDYVEPFVGGANVIDKVPDVFRARIGNDVNAHVISMFQAVQKGWHPPDTVSETEYRRLMGKKLALPTDPESALIGFVGIGCSYAGRWFEGYARGASAGGVPRNYCLESKNNLLSQNISGVQFTNCDYSEMRFTPGSLVYCDPPYAGTKKYLKNFDHRRFWTWCDALSNAGHSVFVSEYSAPETWRCIWEKSVNSSLTKDTGAKQQVEKLFTRTKS